MSNPYFRFKQFTVYHEKSAHKVGFDGVTLGAWSDVSDAKTILDIGTGSGLIALMLAQRCVAQITAIDIHADSVKQATENFRQSEWQDRLSVLHSSLQDFVVYKKEIFDLIVSNPPFFDNSLQAKGTGRSNARHTNLLSKSDLITDAKQLLSPNGRFCVILPVDEAKQVIEIAKESDLHCHKLVKIFPTINKEAKRWMLEFSKKKSELQIDSLIVESSRHNYTSEYCELVKDFYLNL